MGWTHPQISLQEMVNLVKGFVEILVLGCGYQSTGVLANWDVPNLRKAFQWAEFFESFFLEFSNSEYYRESAKELDGVILELTSTASFPQGLAHLSSTMLTKARKLVVEQLLRGLPLRNEHLRAVVVATVETDVCGISNVEDGSLSQYLNTLTLQCTTPESELFSNGSGKFLRESCSDRDANMDEKPVVGGYTGICIQALLKRKSSASCALDLATEQNVISHAVTSNNPNECGETCRQGRQWAATTVANEGNEEEQVMVMISHQWKVRTLSFFLDKRTARLVSGARILFTAPQAQWSRLLDQLNIPEELNDDSSSAKVELLLFGCISRRWSGIVKHFSSNSFSYGNTLEMLSEIYKLLPERHERFWDVAPSVENALIEYLTKLLNGRLSLLWRLHPILPAVAIPSSSLLFKVYLSKIERLLGDDSPTSRCCTCSQEKVEHSNCDLAERIWCLHMSHVRCSHLWHPSSDD
ncbi:hypothetical protein MLD38_030073 [Melastoma candidum]|uniref:Uncharacterized protein n=1 Tax=Melastoma candidum TaxID=119954 RepID=A0ACB9MP53_9MYRT|nr:hypothetical protein MLD38_030073 [Melastoma candidum]